MLEIPQPVKIGPRLEKTTMGDAIYKDHIRLHNHVLGHRDYMEDIGQWINFFAQVSLIHFIQDFLRIIKVLY